MPSPADGGSCNTATAQQSEEGAEAQGRDIPCLRRCRILGALRNGKVIMEDRADAHFDHHHLPPLQLSDFRLSL
jgi:hypothetical protein